jgi:predicted dienelactone hydrolase
MKSRRGFTIVLFALLVLLVLGRLAHRRAAIRSRLQAQTEEQLSPPQPGNEAARPCTTAVGYRVLHIGDRVAAVWYPTAAQPSLFAYGPQFSGMVASNAPVSRACGAAVPLVVFSHGDLGCGLQSVAFTEELARSGYVVVAPDHADASLCHTAPAPPGAAAVRGQPRIADPGAWDDASRIDRRQDVEAAIDNLLQDPEFSQVIDAGKIGLAGHSLGGYTVMGIAGAWPSWLDPRVRAVLAMSPYVMPFQGKHTLGNVHVPLMYQGGTLDVGITPFLMGAKGAYAAANPPAYFVELRGAGHFAWVNCGKAQTTEACLASESNTRLVNAYGIAFFNRYLKGLEEPVLDRPNPMLAHYEYEPGR